MFLFSLSVCLLVSWIVEVHKYALAQEANDPDTDLRISWGALVLDRHLWSLSSCLVKEGARGSGAWQTCIYFTQQNF